MIQSESDFSFSFSLPPCSRSNGIIIIQRDFARTNEPRDCFGYLETRRGLRGSGQRLERVGNSNMKEGRRILIRAGDFTWRVSFVSLPLIYHPLNFHNAKIHFRGNGTRPGKGDINYSDPRERDISRRQRGVHLCR